MKTEPVNSNPHIDFFLPLCKTFVCGWDSSFTLSSPSNIKALLFEKPNFDGACIEVDSDVYSLQEQEVEETDKPAKNEKTLSTVGSVKILGGLWVSEIFVCLFVLVLQTF